MKSKLSEQLEAMARRPAASPNRSGFRLDVEIGWGSSVPNTIEIAKLIRDIGWTLEDAKTAVDELLATRSVRVSLPAVADEAAFEQRVMKAGATLKIIVPAFAK